MNNILTLLVIFTCYTSLFCQLEQGMIPTSYLYDDLVWEDHSEKTQGYHLFYPEGKIKQDLKVVFFVHGYGAINPMIFGKWIKHLVKQGSVVIYPRYQRNLVFPRPPRFSKYAGKAYHAAIKRLKEIEKIQLAADEIYFTGHSYGGVIITQIANNQKKYKLPAPKAILSSEPGTGPFTGGIMKNYNNIPKETQVVIISGSRDWTVQDYYAKYLFQRLNHIEHLSYFLQEPESFDSTRISASHYEPYSLDKSFDNGYMNYTSRKALRVSKLDVIDYNVYWNILDQMMNQSSIENEDLFSDADYYFGSWNAEQPMQPLKRITKVAPLKKSDIRKKMKAKYREYRKNKTGLSEPRANKD